MSVQQTHVASVLGITAQFVDLRGGAAKFLPQQIILIGQGEAGISYSTDKYQVLSKGAAKARFGYRGPIAHALDQLLPANGDGVGGIPIFVCPLAEAGGAAAAEGTITPSGTPTEAAEYVARIGGIRSKPFVIDAGALTGAALHTALRRMGLAISEVVEMPVHQTWTYGTVTAGALVGTGNGTLTALSVNVGSSPKPGAYTLELTEAVVNGGVWTLTDPDGVVISDAITQTVGAATATPFDNIGGLDFTITDGSTDFGLGATFTITVPATNVKLPAAWKGSSGNDLVIEVLTPEVSVGVTFAIVQPTGGLVNPSVTSALGKIGQQWGTVVINCLNIEDETALDAYNTEGELRWGTTQHRPFVVFTGNTHATVEDATEVSSGRRTDRINGQLVAPGSVMLPCMVAARQAGLIARVANEDPAFDYVGQEATGLLPGADEVQWDDLQRDAALKLGSSTVTVEDKVVKIGDAVTFYRPTGEDPPAYRKVVNIMKLQNALFNFRLEFAKKEWAAAPLVNDDDPTTHPSARKPRDAVTAANAILDDLGDAAMLANVAAAKKKTAASIDEQNPDRINLRVQAPLSGNANVRDVVFEFGFNYGGAAA